MNDVCRTCLSTSKLSPLQNDESLLSKIETISSIHISLDIPNYPKVICEDCIEKVNSFFCFRKVIINSDNELREKCEAMINNKIRKISTKTTRNCDKLTRKKVVKKRKKPTKSEKQLEQIKSEPSEDDSILDRLVIYEEDIKLEEKHVKEEIESSCTKNLLTLECTGCTLTFQTQLDLNNHNKNTHKLSKKRKSLDCAECNLTFMFHSELANHKRSFHTAPGICNICGVVVRADNLKKHVQRHSEGPVRCKICLKLLKNSESLRGHLLIHKGTSYLCEQCDKTFTLKSEYHRHLKKHTDPNVRKKMCTVCGKHVRDLQRHLFTHTGERPYICIHCNKGLTSSYALKLHIRQHTNEKPFICEFCNKGFAQKVSLKAHLKSKAHS